MAIVLVALAATIALAPAFAQRTVPAQPFPSASPLVWHFQSDPRMERLEKALPALVAKPTDWSNYPVLTGFFAANFQRHPDWIQPLIPDQLDAKTADMLRGALRLSGHAPGPQIARRLATAGHDPKLSDELSDLPARLEDLHITKLTHIDIFWGAYFATGDAQYALPILSLFVDIANLSRAVSVDITRMTVAMDTDNRDIIKDLKDHHDRPELARIVVAATAELGLVRNAQNYPAIKRLLTNYTLKYPHEEAAKSLAAFLKHI